MSLELEQQFLVAMPNMTDPRFQQAVIYICEHSGEGAMGLMINKPLKLSLGRIMKHLDLKVKDSPLADQPVLVGGPIGERQGFLLQIDSAGAEDINNIKLSSAKEDLIAMATGVGPENVLVLLGYCGWAPGQLENEIKENAWLVAPASTRILFNTPFTERWRKAATLIGVDFNRLSNHVGHA